MANSIIIYSSLITNRLRYVSGIIMDRLGIDYELTDAVERVSYGDNPCINYSNENIPDAIRIVPIGLLTQQDIIPQELSIQRWKKTTILFYNQPSGVVPFDLFAAVFYLITRYEEYLPHQKDKHGRYPASESVAHNYRFLDVPVIDFWIKELGLILSSRYGYDIKRSNLMIQHTIDIDLLWKYKGKPWYKRLLALLYYRIKYPSTAKHEEKKDGDPYFCFDKIGDALRVNNHAAHFFVLNPERKTKYDRIMPTADKEFKSVLLSLGSRNAIGIHPSYHAGAKDLIAAEKMNLEKTINKSITKSRQHYIKLDTPHTYRQLIMAGITDDYTMGYPEIKGYRASTNYPFPWYDLSTERVSSLMIHPFAFMDATAIFYNRMSASATYQTLRDMIAKAQDTGGIFTIIWHNYILGDKKVYKGWWALWEKILQEEF